MACISVLVSEHVCYVLRYRPETQDDAVNDCVEASGLKHCHQGWEWQPRCGMVLFSVR